MKIAVQAKPDTADLSAYDYWLPQELIAQYPLPSRDGSRLMVVDRRSGNISEMPFCAIDGLLGKGDRLIFNNTQVTPRRLNGRKASGGRVEIFLVERVKDAIWKVLARPLRKLKIGTKIYFSDSFSCIVEAILGNGLARVRFDNLDFFDENLKLYGEIPLPPYIRRKSEVVDFQRYQTVYAKVPGAAAAPTAGLHFSEHLLQKLSKKGVELCNITLHIGLGTFKPVVSSNLKDHKMHKERYSINEEAARQLNKVCQRQICVGTTCCRALESAVDDSGKIVSRSESTDIFIYPGYRFKFVQSLLTNFHLPRSTLLMLVCAFAGYELTMEAYAKAVKDEFRFFSYGDAMLIL